MSTCQQETASNVSVAVMYTQLVDKRNMDTEHYFVLCSKENPSSINVRLPTTISGSYEVALVQLICHNLKTADEKTPQPAELVHVTCNLIQPQPPSTTDGPSLQLLRVSTVSELRKQSTFPLPIYLPLVRNQFQEISVQLLRDSSGKFVQFESTYGQTVAVLHLRHRNAITTSESCPSCRAHS